MEHLVILAFVFLNLFMVVGAIDLFYFHLWKYKLHTRPESRYEHKLHMTFAFLMVPLAALLYLRDFGGWALWVGVAAVVAALVIELLDVFSEGDSRASIGGLTTAEYSLHVVATMLKVASFAFIFASKPAEAWGIGSPLVLGTYGFVGEIIALKVMVGSFLVAILHLLLLDRRFVAFGCQTACDLISCRRFTCCSG